MPKRTAAAAGRGRGIRYWISEHHRLGPRLLGNAADRYVCGIGPVKGSESEGGGAKAECTSAQLRRQDAGAESGIGYQSNTDSARACWATRQNDMCVVLGLSTVAKVKAAAPRQRAKAHSCGGRTRPQNKVLDTSACETRPCLLGNQQTDMCVVSGLSKVAKVKAAAPRQSAQAHSCGGRMQARNQVLDTRATQTRPALAVQRDRTICV